MVGTARQTTTHAISQKSVNDRCSTEEGIASSSDSEHHEPESEAEEDYDVETWVEWLKRTTGFAEDQLCKLGVDDW